MPNSSRRPSRNENDHAFSTPVTDRIEMEDGSGRRLSVSFSPATPWTQALFLGGLFGAVPVGIATYYLYLLYQIPYYRSVGSIAIGVAVFAFGGAFLAWIWRRWLYTAIITVRDDAVTFQTVPLLSNGTTTRIAAEALDDVRVEMGSLSEDDGTSYNLLLKQKSEATQEQALSDGPYAEQEEIWVAGGLPSREEAEWIVDRMAEAAEQQTSAS